MITRIVRMEFVPEKVDEFLSLFRAAEDRIRNFPGVAGLELFRDIEMENVFFTISKWRSEQDLDAYRKSELFRDVWTKTRSLFLKNAFAYSLVNV